MDDISELEDRYQTQKVLSSGTDAQVEVTDVGWDIIVSGEQASLVVYLCLDVVDGEEYTIGLPSAFDPEHHDDIVHLFKAIDERPQQNLEVLCGKSFDASLGQAGENKALTLKIGGYQITGVVDERIDVGAHQSTLPQDVVHDLTRASRYADENDEGMPVPVRNLSHADGELTATLGHECGCIRMETNTTAEPKPETRYERFIEYVGGGSVKQVEGSELYLSHESDITLLEDIGTEADRREIRETAPDIFEEAMPDTDEEFLEKRMDNFVMFEETSTGGWAVTATPPDSERANEAVVIGAVVGGSVFLVGVGMWSLALMLFGVLLGVAISLIVSSVK